MLLLMVLSLILTLPGKPCKFKTAPWLSKVGYLTDHISSMGYVALLSSESVVMTFPKLRLYIVDSDIFMTEASVGAGRFISDSLNILTSVLEGYIVGRFLNVIRPLQKREVAKEV